MLNLHTLLSLVAKLSQSQSQSQPSNYCTAYVAKLCAATIESQQEVYAAEL